MAWKGTGWKAISEAIEAAGGVPVHISLIPDEDYIRAVIAGLEGVLLPGSDSDVDPLRYGHEPHPKIGAVHPMKDERVRACVHTERRHRRSEKLACRLR